MNKIIFVSGAICNLALLRIGLQQQANVWIAWRNYHAEGVAHNCTAFHEIMAARKPWYVKVNTWLEEHHV